MHTVIKIKTNGLRNLKNLSWTNKWLHNAEWDNSSTEFEDFGVNKMWGIRGRWCSPQFLLLLLITMVPSCAVLWSTGAVVTIDRLSAIPVEYAVVVDLLQGVRHAVRVVMAGHQAVFKVSNLVRVQKVSLAFDRVLAFTGWTPVFFEIVCIIINTWPNLWSSLTFSAHWCR